MTSFYTPAEIAALGFKSYGNNVLISRKTSIYSAETMTIGDNVRIDDFCILSGNLSLGSNIHISAHVSMFGKEGIIMEDYTGISPYSVIYSAMDDFSGDYLIGPIHDSSKINVTGGVVQLKAFSQIGSHCVVFPNLIVETGAVVGAMSLVRNNLEAWTINAGIPAKKIRDRRRGVLHLISK